MKRLILMADNNPLGGLYLLACLLIACISSAHAGPVDRRQVPADGVIRQPGVYYLAADTVVERDYGIKVLADDVTVDLGGYALRYGGSPGSGILGIIANDRRNLHVTNGSIGGFWFGTHCTQNQGLVIDNVAFDDIPYLAINVAQSRDVVIRDCIFTNFRYDIPKEKDTYVIGINIGATDAVISGNKFNAEYSKADPNEVGMETVFVLFSANVSDRCVVTLNDMAANVVLPRSYGIWVASNANICAAYNTIRNMKYGICLASDASAVASYNTFAADPPPVGAEPIETVGVSAGAPKAVHVIKNRYDGLTTAALLPERMGVVE